MSVNWISIFSFVEELLLKHLREHEFCESD